MNLSVDVRKNQIENAYLYEKVDSRYSYPEKFRIPVCCDDLVAAMRSGTDSEGYGAAMGIHNGKLVIGSMYGQKAEYCPFCGTEITKYNWAK